MNKVANRYSKAIYDLAVEKKVVKSIMSDVDSILTLMNDSSEFNELIVSPVMTTDEKKLILEKTILAKSSTLHELTQQLLRLLLNKKRIELLESVCLSIVDRNKKENNIVDAIVESALPLDKKQIDEIKSHLERKFSKTVNIENPVNEALIGGIRILVDDVMIDHSLQTKISNLRKAMVSG